MKNTLTDLLCWALCAALIIGAICLGAVSGWRGERDRVLHPAGLSGDIRSVLEERAMDAANLHVVASRHLPEDDERLTQLLDIRRTLENEAAATSEKARADEALTALAQRLGQELPALDSVLQSPRDQVYISALTRTLGESTQSGASYAGQVRDFNSRLNTSLTGRLAQWLGVAPLSAEGGEE